MESARVHATAILEEGVELGRGTSVWDNVHIRRGARIGDECIIGEKSYLAPDVLVGNRVKINAFVYICTGVTIEDGVMVSAGTTFTNDLLPRATTPDLSELRSSEPDEDTKSTVIREGATLGARSVIGCDLEIGRFAMIGMGSVITRSVPAFSLVYGNPARVAGFVCRCGRILARFRDAPPEGELTCSCGRSYQSLAGELGELQRCP